MKKMMIFLVLAFGYLYAQDILPFYNLQNSGYTANNEICVSYEGGLLTDTHRLFATNQNGNWQQKTIFENSFGKKSAWIPYNNTSGAHWRLELENDYAYFGTMPWVSNTPAFEDYAKCGADSLNDSAVENADNLDIKTQYFAYSDSKYYVGMQNNSSAGFPTAEGFTGPYYLYIVAMVNPSSAITDSTAYAFVYANLSPLVTPGLYKINLASLTSNPLNAFQRISSINSRVDGDKLFMDCNISDIENAEGDNWPPINNLVSLIAFTVKIEVTSVMPFNVTPAFGDYGKIAIVKLNDKHIEPFVNTVPNIASAFENIDDSHINVTVDYTDNENNFPVFAKLIMGDGRIFDFKQSSSWLFSENIRFSIDNIEIYGGNTSMPLIVKFSDDNENYVEAITTNGVSTNDDLQVNAINSLTLAPNPFGRDNKKLRISAKKGCLKGAIYNIKGQIIKNINTKNSFYDWNGLTNANKKASSGIYFVKLKNQRKVKVKKLLIIR